MLYHANSLSKIIQCENGTLYGKVMKANDTVGHVLFVEKWIFSESHCLVIYVESHSELSKDIFPLYSPSCYPQSIFGTHLLLHLYRDFCLRAATAMKIQITGMKSTPA